MSPIVPYISAEHLTDQLAVPLARYAQIVDYSESAFFGVAMDGQDEYACRTIWTRWQRQAVARALMSAQDKFWTHCHYPFTPTYIAGERHDYNRTALLNNCNVIGMGIKVDAPQASAVTIDYTSDPASITCATSATNPDELHVYHPGTDYEIMPSKITIAGGWATIEIPRVRMVALAYDDNPEAGWDYTDDTYFETDVDVRWIYLDNNYQVQVFGMNGNAWSYYWNAAYLRDHGIGHIRLADCNCTSALACFSRHYMDINYLCGLPSLTVDAEDAIVRLAHTLMPEEPCGCDFLRGMWNRDKTVPDVLTAERENCPLGMSNGAWQAYCFMQSMVCYRGGTL